MAQRTQVLIIGLSQEALDLIDDAKARAEREAGFPITKQAFLRKHMNEIADAEQALQLAGEEYAKQQEESEQ